jgi:hypothetical protein
LDLCRCAQAQGHKSEGRRAVLNPASSMSRRFWWVRISISSLPRRRRIGFRSWSPITPWWSGVSSPARGLWRAACGHAGLRQAGLGHGTDAVDRGPLGDGMPLDGGGGFCYGRHNHLLVLRQCVGGDHEPPGASLTKGLTSTYWPAWRPTLLRSGGWCRPQSAGTSPCRLSASRGRSKRLG